MVSLGYLIAIVLLFIDNEKFNIFLSSSPEDGAITIKLGKQQRYVRSKDPA